jgi:hypothetical protein
MAATRRRRAAARRWLAAEERALSHAHIRAATRHRFAPWEYSRTQLVILPGGDRIVRIGLGLGAKPWHDSDPAVVLTRWAKLVICKPRPLTPLQRAKIRRNR